MAYQAYNGFYPPSHNLPTALNALAMIENPPFLPCNKDFFNYIEEYTRKLRDCCYCLPLKFFSDQINFLPVGYITQPLCQFLYNCTTQISLPMVNWKEWEVLSNNDEGGMIRKGGGRGRETRGVDDAFKAAISKENEDSCEYLAMKDRKKRNHAMVNAKHVDLESTKEEKTLFVFRLCDC